MKDIDFDELDKAVGSVLNSGAATPSATATADPKPAPAADAAPPASPAPDRTPVTPSASISPAVSPARKRGQFLDMVHPSADMTKTPKMPTAVRKSVQPLSSSLVGESIPTPTPTPTPSLHPPTNTLQQVQPEPTEAAKTMSSDDVAENTTETTHETWPDPLDFAQESAEAASVSQQIASEPPVDVVSEQQSDTEQVESAQTPFVPDAKVDKRPLGAFATPEETAPTEIEAPTASTVPSEEAPEFNSDVNSVESAGLSHDESEEVAALGDAGAVAAPESDEVMPVVDTPPAGSEETPAAPVAEQPVSVPPAAGQSASIPQQYKTAETPQTEESTHPLFDSEEYHQPLLPDGKKKSKKVVLIVILLIVLLLIGGGLGYIAYTMGI